MQPVLTIGPAVLLHRSDGGDPSPRRPHDLNKLPKRVASCGQTGFYRCQVGEMMTAEPVTGAQNFSATQVTRRRIDYRRLAKVRIIPCKN